MYSGMPRVKHQVAKRLIRLACAVISQDCLNKLELKKKKVGEKMGV